MNEFTNDVEQVMGVFISLQESQMEASKMFLGQNFQMSQDLDVLDTWFFPISFH